LYINRPSRIVGYKDEESEYLLKFLFDHISKGADFQIRARYEPGTVVVWVRCIFFQIRLFLTELFDFFGQDNRVAAHSRLADFSTLRHVVRLMAQAEIPIEGKADA
jgi:sulfonate dioxygenase